MITMITIKYYQKLKIITNEIYVNIKIKSTIDYYNLIFIIHNH